MLDYKLLSALATVIECGGFERAGETLGLRSVIATRGGTAYAVGDQGAMLRRR